jgi:hypothetical protein
MPSIAAVGPHLACGALLAALVCASPAAAQLPDLPRQPASGLVAVGGAPQVSLGKLARNQTIVSIPVRHATTGVRRPGAAPMFAITLPVEGADQLVWCQPRLDLTAPKSGEQTATCYPVVSRSGGAGEARAPVAAAVHAPQGLYAKSFSLRTPADPVEGLAVEARPMAVGGPMRMTYDLGRVNDTSVEIQVRVTWAGGDAQLDPLRLPRRQDGAATLKVFGGEVRLTPDASGGMTASQGAPFSDLPAGLAID